MKKAILTPLAPQPIGPYSQAIQAGNMLFISGQVAFDPATGALLLDSIETETERVMLNLKAILETAGATFDQVVKTSIFLRTMDDFARMNAVYEKFFQAVPPARETVAVAGLPRNVNVEISMIAMLQDHITL